MRSFSFIGEGIGSAVADAAVSAGVVMVTKVVGIGVASALLTSSLLCPNGYIQSQSWKQNCGMVASRVESQRPSKHPSLRAVTIIGMSPGAEVMDDVAEEVVLVTWRKPVRKVGMWTILSSRYLLVEMVVGGNPSDEFCTGESMLLYLFCALPGY
jgi:hypothetical protein